VECHPPYPESSGLPLRVLSVVLEVHMWGHCDISLQPPPKKENLIALVSTSQKSMTSQNKYAIYMFLPVKDLRNILKRTSRYIGSFIPDISTASLQVHYY